MCPICQESDTWQLIINTGTTIITEALQRKLDELIGVNGNARNRRVPPLQGQRSDGWIGTPGTT
jgi:low affinity Fe/Cu permease